MRDLGIVERDGETFLDGRKADRLRFFLVPNEDGTQCETYWWNGYLATHAILAPSLPLSADQADSGFVEIDKTEWRLFDTDSNGFFYPQYVKDFILKIIGPRKQRGTNMLAGEIVTIEIDGNVLKVKIEDASKSDFISGRVESVESGETYTVGQVCEFERAAVKE